MADLNKDVSESLYLDLVATEQHHTGNRGFDELSFDLRKAHVTTDRRQLLTQLVIFLIVLVRLGE